MPTTPRWEGAVNGPAINLNATNHAAQMSQTLGTHGITPIYQGNQIITPVGGATTFRFFPSNSLDIAQPFVMPGGKTTVGRVGLPIIASGNGADVMVKLLPDNGGVPDTNNVLASTMLPADWLTNLTSFTGINAGGPITVAQNNIKNPFGLFITPWAGVTVDSSGSALIDSATTCSGDFLISAGGLTANISNSVITAQFGGTGVLATPVLQAPLPQASFYGMLTATTDSLVYVGGNTTNPAVTLTANVYTASWDEATGAIGTWSLQTALPVALYRAASASSGNTVYVTGGVDNGLNVLSSVYYATVNNGQITSWTKGPSLPKALQAHAMAVVNGWLIVAGGAIDTAGNTSSSVYYAKVNANGSIGTWNVGPSLPVPVWTWSPGWNMAAGDDFISLVSGQTGPASFTNITQSMTVSVHGPSDQWRQFTTTSSSAQVTGYFPVDDGVWDIFILGPNLNGTQYSWLPMTTVPQISVPLYATGLTPGNTYYVMIQEHQYRSSSDFISFIYTNGSLPGDLIKRNRNIGTWVPQISGYSMPIAVYDNAVNVAGNTSILHTWEDPSSTGSTYSSNIAGRVTAFVYNRYDNMLGYCDSVNMPNDPLNSNPTFTTGVSGWTPHNCTFVQSNAQVHGGFPFSGLMTPNGVAAAPNVTSNLVPVTDVLVSFVNVEWYVMNGWFYSPTGWSNVSLSVDWYDSNQTYISTSNNTTTLPAATWTNLISFYLIQPNASYASINLIEAGSPAAGNTIFFSNVTITGATELTLPLASAAQVVYGNSSVWPPIGVTQLT